MANTLNIEVVNLINDIDLNITQDVRVVNIEIDQIGIQGATGSPGQGVPNGGLEGQLLSKKTATDYDTEWIDVASLTIADATTVSKGIIQLAGDLTGTAAAPLIADGVITDAKVANGIDKAKVGLGNVENTSDADKPISIATQEALDLKAPIDQPIFTGGVISESYQITDYTGNRLLLDSGNLLEPNLENDTRFLSSTSLGEPEGNPPVWELITKSTFGLENVDNTSDLDKPISNDTQAALNLKLENSFETISKNLKSFNYTFNYTGELLSSITYDTLDGDIIKTFNYTDDKLTSIVLSGEIPLGIYSTKTFTYSGEELINITYS